MTGRWGKVTKAPTDRTALLVSSFQMARVTMDRSGIHQTVVMVEPELRSTDV